MVSLLLTGPSNGTGTDRSVCCKDVVILQFFGPPGADGHLLALVMHDAEALRWLDALAPGGAAEAARLYCNRALCLLRMDPPRAEAAEADASCALLADAACAKVGGAVGDEPRHTGLAEPARSGP